MRGGLLSYVRWIEIQFSVMIGHHSERIYPSFYLIMLNTPDDTPSSSRFSVATFAPRAIAIVAFTALTVGALRAGLSNVYEKGAEDYLAYDGLLL